KDESAFYREAAKLKIGSYFQLKGPAAWRRWLAQQGPVVAALIPDRQFTSATRTSAQLYRYDPALPYGRGHAVVLVGYTTTHFILRNSWGRGWGDSGYAYLYDAYAKAAIFEAYGIQL